MYLSMGTNHDLKELSENHDDVLHHLLTGLMAVLVSDDLHVVPDTSRLQVQHCLRSQLEDVRFQFLGGSTLDEHLVGRIYQLDTIL